VSVEDGGVVVEDLGSTNGTFVDDRRVTRRAGLPVGGVVRFGDHAFRCERGPRREAHRVDVERRDLERAASYVSALLPAPIDDGPVRAEWVYEPSARLGGDAFSYGFVDERTFVVHLLDVSGHGVGAAMHAVSILNVLRQRALPGADFRDPGAVVGGLNTMFQMERHDEQCFSCWCASYDVVDRTLTHACAGHHPAFLVGADGAARPLKAPGPLAGVVPDAAYRTEVAAVSPGATLFVFSDGAFEIASSGGSWRLDDFVALLADRAARGRGGCRHLRRRLEEAAGSPALDDDLALLAVTFP
jgi:serine phosphatase RsbU (regulator of sigma subunit)